MSADDGTPLQDLLNAVGEVCDDTSESIDFLLDFAQTDGRIKRDKLRNALKAYLNSQGENTL